MRIGYDSMKSPFGMIYVVADEVGVRKVELWEDSWQKYKEINRLERDINLCKEAVCQLDEYFNKKRKKFDLTLSLSGTEFRLKVWKALSDIPYGEVRSYQQIADYIGNHNAVRAVGQANKANSLPIIIPCHRVIGKSGALVGYAGDKTDVKRILLELEGYKSI